MPAQSRGCPLPIPVRRHALLSTFSCSAKSRGGQPPTLELPTTSLVCSPTCVHARPFSGYPLGSLGSPDQDTKSRLSAVGPSPPQHSTDTHAVSSGQTHFRLTVPVTTVGYHQVARSTLSSVPSATSSQVIFSGYSQIPQIHPTAYNAIRVRSELEDKIPIRRFLCLIGTLSPGVSNPGGTLPTLTVRSKASS